MKSKVSLFVSMLLLAVGMHAKAAVLDVQGTINVAINGGVTTQAGNIDTAGSVADGADDWAISLTPINTHSDVTVLKFSEFPGGSITNLVLYESDGTFVTSAAGLVIAALDGAKSYVLRVVGTPAASYVVNLSAVNAVPIPAAAVLFLSGLAGFGLLSRRRNPG